MIGGDLLEALTPVVDLLERLGIAYHLGGSLASSAHGVARSTLDVDVVADLRPEHAPLFATKLADSYYLDEPAIAAAIDGKGAFNLIHLTTMLKIDVFVPAASGFDRAELGRSRPEAIGTRRFYVKSPEDVVLRKLCWFRDGGEISERQWSDVLGVLRVQGASLDLDYMRRWADQLGVTDLLTRATAAAGRSD